MEMIVAAHWFLLLPQCGPRPPLPVVSLMRQLEHVAIFGAFDSAGRRLSGLAERHMTRVGVDGVVPPIV